MACHSFDLVFYPSDGYGFRQSKTSSLILFTEKFYYVESEGESVETEGFSVIVSDADNKKIKEQFVIIPVP